MYIIYIVMLPKNLNYGSKVESAPARSYRTNIAPQNGTGGYNLGDTIIFNIPTRNNLVMAPTESYLKFDHVITNGTAINEIRFDSCGAHGLIQRVRIWHGSNLLQDIDNYGLLAKFLFDLQVPTDAAFGKLNILTGTRADYKLVANITAADPANTVFSTANAYTDALLNTSSVMAINSGDIIASALAVTTASTKRTYCLNLISLIGSLCSTNYFPLFACTSAPLRVEILLADSLIKALAIGNTTGSPTSVLSNVEFVGNFIELSDVAMSMIQSSIGSSPLQFVVSDYRNYQYSAVLNNSVTNLTVPIPAKFSSLKSLFCMWRDKGTGQTTMFPFSTVKANLTDYTFRIGSTVVPAKAPNTTTEFFAELVKAIGSISDLNHQPAIDSRSYAMDASYANSVNAVTSSASFYIGLDLENYCTAPKDQIFAGYNSNTDDIYFMPNFAANATVPTCRFDTFALFDCAVVFENNTVFVRY